MWFIVDSYKLAQAHAIVYDAAEAAATSASTQASYTIGTQPGGTAFTDGVNQGQATSVANTTFQLESQKLDLSSVVNISNTSIVFPSAGQASYSVTVSYVPQGIFAALDVLNTLFNSGHIPPSTPPITWTETAIANHNQD